MPTRWPYGKANVDAHEYGMSLLKPGMSCAEVTQKINTFFEDRDLLQYRTFGYGHSFGVLSHYYGREAGLELREDIDTILQPGMVISMEPMLTIPDGQPGAGGYREHDILIITEDGNENITGFPMAPHTILLADTALPDDIECRQGTRLKTAPPTGFYCDLAIACLRSSYSLHPSQQILSSFARLSAAASLLPSIKNNSP